MWWWSCGFLYTRLCCCYYYHYHYYYYSSPLSSLVITRACLCRLFLKNLRILAFLFLSIPSSVWNCSSVIFFLHRTLLSLLQPSRSCGSPCLEYIRLPDLSVYDKMGFLIPHSITNGECNSCGTRVDGVRKARKNPLFHRHRHHHPCPSSFSLTALEKIHGGSI